MTLVEFLLARFGEDEAVARDAIDPERPGTHWQWKIPGGADPDGPLWLRTVEEFPTASGVGPLPAFPLGYEVTADSSRAMPHIARHDPARVLAECASKRQIIEAYVPDGTDPHPGQPCTNNVEDDPDGEEYAELKQWGEAGACVRHLAAWATRHHSERVLKLLALPYAGHSDFDETWRP